MMKRFALAVFGVILAMTAQTLRAEEIAGRDVLISDQRTTRSQPAPLVLALHGAGGSPKSFRARSRFDRAARSAGVIVAYPSADGGVWRDGRQGRDPGDVDYLEALIAALQSDPRIAQGPVFVVGHSNGGGMALRLACDRPDLVAAIGIVATKVPAAYACGRGRPVPAVFVHGTADPVSAHDGDARAGTLSAAESLSLWQRRNGCSANVRIKRIDQNRRDKTSVVSRRYTGCRADLQHFLVLGGGHGWPTATARSSGRLGPQSGEINAGTEIIRFFSQIGAR